MQIPYLARHCRVVTFDGRGNGRSDRPGAAATTSASSPPTRSRSWTRPATERAVIVSLSLGAQRALLLAAEHPERVEGAVFICPAVPLGEAPPARGVHSWDDELDTDEGWAKYNRHYWLRDYRGFLEFFFSQMFTEPHSTKPIEDCVGWGLETTPETLDRDAARRDGSTRTRTRELAGARPLPGARDPGHGRRDHRPAAAASRSRRRPAASSCCSRARATARTCATR